MVIGWIGTVIHMRRPDTHPPRIIWVGGITAHNLDLWQKVLARPTACHYLHPLPLRHKNLTHRHTDRPTSIYQVKFIRHWFTMLLSA